MRGRYWCGKEISPETAVIGAVSTEVENKDLEEEEEASKITVVITDVLACTFIVTMF